MSWVSNGKVPGWNSAIISNHHSTITIFFLSRSSAFRLLCVRGRWSRNINLCVRRQVRKLQRLVRGRRGSGVMACYSCFPVSPPLAWIGSWPVMSVGMRWIWNWIGRRLTLRPWCPRYLQEGKREVLFQIEEKENLCEKLVMFQAFAHEKDLVCSSRCTEPI